MCLEAEGQQAKRSGDPQEDATSPQAGLAGSGCAGQRGASPRESEAYLDSHRRGQGLRRPAGLTVHFRASLKHKNVSQTKFIKLNSQR